MAMSVTLAQPFAATFGAPCTFVATVANSSGGNVNLNAMQPVVSLPNGQYYAGAVIGLPQPSAQTSIANTGGYQFNVVIPASGNVIFTFQVDFGCNAVAAGTAASPQCAFVVSVNCYSSDGSSFSAQAPLTQLQLPIFGPPNSMGSPSNQWPGAFPTFGTAAASPQAPGTMDFQNLFNAVFAL